MLCKECKEQIEVGEAYREEIVANHPRYFHTGCFIAYKAKTVQHYTELSRQADLARTVH